MRTSLPSGVEMEPVLATRLNVCVLPETVPGVHTMPSLGAPTGSASACSGTSAAPPATSATTRPSRLIFFVMAAFLPRRAGAWSDIGLTHDGLRGKRVLVHPDLGHHPARPRRRPGVGQPPPVPVLELVDVVVALGVRSGRSGHVVCGRVEQHVPGLAR